MNYYSNGSEVNINIHKVAIAILALHDIVELKNTQLKQSQISWQHTGCTLTLNSPHAELKFHVFLNAHISNISVLARVVMSDFNESKNMVYGLTNMVYGLTSIWMMAIATSAVYTPVHSVDKVLAFANSDSSKSFCGISRRTTAQAIRIARAASPRLVSSKFTCTSYVMFAQLFWTCYRSISKMT